MSMRWFGLIFLFLLASCASAPHKEEARDIALAAGFSEKHIVAAPFILTGYERVRIPDGNVHLYIEGDGHAWAGKSRPSQDPTPLDPLALKLAAQDSGSNVIYLARPCQYSGSAIGHRCLQEYWTSHRFASEVIESMSQALDDIKARYGIKSFDLVGYSGGANIAALLAARRNDIASLRTVAGNLDHELLHRIHGVSQIPDSLNAKDEAEKIRHIPQHHFFGGKDKIVPPDIIDSFMKAAGNSACIRYTIVPEATHHDGWVGNWSEFMSMPIDCKNRN